MDHMHRAAEAIRRSKKIVFSTGAGISAASGIPTFRDKLTGLWEKHDPERLETAAAFRENPALVWGWYLWRRHQVAQAQPNSAGISQTNPKFSQETRNICTYAVHNVNVDRLCNAQ